MKQFLRVAMLQALFVVLLSPLSGKAQQQTTNSLTPIPYPVLKSTGNPEVDKKNHAEAVKRWEIAEKKRNESLKSSGSSTNKLSGQRDLSAQEAKIQKEIQKNPTKFHREITIIDLPGYPKYIASGNPKEDDERYASEKAEWISKNEAAYQKYLQDASSKQNNKLKRSPKSSGSN
jgi:hypothetical protein